MSKAPEGCPMEEIYSYLMDPILLSDHTEEQQEEIGGRYADLFFSKLAKHTKCLAEKGDTCCMTEQRREEFKIWIPSTEDPYPKLPLNS